MADEITGGSLSWTARIDLSELPQDIKTLAELLNKAGNFEFDTSAIDTILKEQAAKEVEYKKDVARQVIDINDNIFNDTKAKTEELKNYLESIPFEIKTEADKGLSEADLSAIRERAKAEVDAVIEAQKYYNSQPKEPIKPPAIDLAAFSSTDAINQARAAYANADAVTKQYLDDLVALEFQLKGLKQAQAQLNASFKEGEVNEEKYLTQSAELKAAIEGVNNEINATKEAQAVYMQSLNGEGEAVEKNITIFTEYRNLRNKIAADAVNGIVNQADIDRAGLLRDTIENVNAELKSKATDYSFINAAAEGVQGLVGGFTALSGAIGLMTNNNETANKIMQDTINFMGVLNGLQQVTQALQSDGKLNAYIKSLLARNAVQRAGTATQVENNVATVANTVTQEANAAASLADAGAKAAEGTATEGATAAQWSLNAAMEANPAAWVILAITALVAAFELFANATDDQIEKQIELNKHLSDTKKLMDDLADISSQPYKDRVTDAEQLLSLAQASGKSAAEIAKLQEKVISAKKELNSYEAGAKGVTATIKDQQDKVQQLAYKYEQLSIEVNNATDPKKKENLQVQLDSVKREYGVAKQIVDDRISLENEGQVAQAANQKKFHDMALANDVDYWQAKVKLSQKGSKEWLDAQLKVNQAAYNKAISQPDANTAKAAADKILADRQAKETFSQQVIKNNQSDISAQLALVAKGTETELDLKLKLLEDERQAAVISAQNNVHEIERINAESEKKKNDLKLQYAQSSADKILQLQEDNLKVMLSGAIQGTEEYLNYTIGANNLLAQTSITDAIAAAAKNKPAISSNDITLSSTFDEQSALDFANKIENIDANLAQRIRAIWAETNNKNQQDTNSFVNSQIDSANKLLSVQSQLAKEGNNKIISDQNASDLAKINAQIRNNKIDLDSAKEELSDFTATVDKNYSGQSETIKKYINSVSTDYSKIKDLSDKDSDIFKAFDSIKDPQLKAALEEILKKIHDINDESESLNKNKFNAYADRIVQIGSLVSQLGQDVSQYDSELGNTISSIGNFAIHIVGVIKNIKQMNAELKNGGKAGFDTYSSAISGVISLIGTLISASKQRREKEREYMAASIAQQREYNLALNDAILLNTQLKDNVFVTDYSGQIVNAWESISDATEHYNEALKKVDDLQVKIGTKKKVDAPTFLGSVGAGATTGAAIGGIAGGGVLSVPAAVVGGVIGAVVGGIVGLFAKKRVDVYGSLFEKYPELLDKSKKGVDAFNDALAQSLIDSNKVKDSSKEVLQSLIDWKKQVEAAKEQMAQVVQTLAGNLGDTIANSLTDAFEQGTDAGKAFADSVKQTLENVIKQQLLNQVFGAAFTELQKRMEASFDPLGGGDMNWTDDLTDFFNQYGALSEQFNEGLKEAQQAAGAAGLDIFESTNGVKNTLAGALQASLTEDTANELAGLWRGQYDITKQSLQVATDALTYHQRIEANTAQSLTLFARYLPQLDYLKKINDNTTPEQIKRDLGL